MNSLEKIIRNIFKVNLGLKQNEKVLIIFDKNKETLAKIFFNVGKQLTDKINKIEIPIGKVHGEEPPQEIAKNMLNYDVEIIITTKSLSHTKARKQACKKGARIATLPGADKEMLMRAINVDYAKMHKRIEKISNLLDKGNTITITSKAGTNLTLNIKGRKAHGRTSGIFARKGKFGNLPDGESFIAPIEGSTNGVYVIDGSLGGIGKIDEPIRILVKNGYAQEIIGNKSAKDLMEQLDKVGIEGRNIAEFGIGANDKAKITGKMLEDEKVIGTCHIALGNNSGFGGKVDIPLHIDGLIKKPTILIDKNKVMDKGRFIL